MGVRAEGAGRVGRGPSKTYPKEMTIMAGYDFDAWKSNNAVDAEHRGLTNATDTASTLRRRGHKGMTSAFVKEHGDAHEWHHTSSKYNETSYYSAEELHEWLSTDEGAAKLTAWKAAKRASRNNETCIFGTVCWMEFEGRKNKTVTNHSFTGELTLRGSRVYFDGRYKSVNGNYISVVEHPADIDWVLVHDVNNDGSRRQNWREIAVLADGTRCLLRTYGRGDARLLSGRERDCQVTWSDMVGHFSIAVTEVTDEDKKKAAERAEAAERKRRRATEKLREVAANPEADADERRRALAWFGERDETIHGTITWGPEGCVRTHTGAITFHDGWVTFDYYPDRTTKIRLPSPNSRSAGDFDPEDVRSNLTITEHDHQTAA